MKMILKTMVCLAVAFSGTAGAANYSPEKSQASLALKVPGNPAEIGRASCRERV